MKKDYFLPHKLRERYGLVGSLIIHLVIFFVLCFSGILSAERNIYASDSVTFFFDGNACGGSMQSSGSASENEVNNEVVDSNQSETVEESFATTTIPTNTNPKVVVAKKAVSNYGKGNIQSNNHGNGSGEGNGQGKNGRGQGSGNGNGNSIVSCPAIAPKIRSTVAPQYPAAQKQAGIEGVTVMQLIVGFDGYVEAVEVIKSSGDSALDKAALNAAKKWRFTAAKNTKGEKVRCYYKLPMRFSLRYE